ncbi:MAG: recombination mediator RecR, partial [Parachlamydiales bacterium]
MYPKELFKLISFLRKLSGVGSKTAERFAFELIKWKNSDLFELSNLFKDLKNNIVYCETCGCLMNDDSCHLCNADYRDTNKLCIVSSFKDVYLIENTKSYKGLYHIIDTLISPIQGKEIDLENIKRLKDRLSANNTKEVIIALDSTVEGDATSLYLKEELNNFNVNISRLAF